jgi:hypothetical protein
MEGDRSRKFRVKTPDWGEKKPDGPPRMRQDAVRQVGAQGAQPLFAGDLDLADQIQ